MQPHEMLRRRPPLALLVLLALALWGGEYLRRGLWEPDEARYACVAREMREGGHWFVPHLNGRPYADKPPLLFWLINAASLLTGGRINGVSARLPSLLGSVLTLRVVTRLLSRRHSTEAAWRAMLVLLTAFLFWREGSWGRTDALLCGLVMTSVDFLFLSLAEEDGAARTRKELAAYLFAGLAVLAKGPVGLVLPMGIFAAAALAGGAGRKLRRGHWLWGPPAALALPAAWLLAARLQGAPPSYFAAMFGEKSFGRIARSHDHRRPFHYFLLHFPAEFMPWTIFLPASLATVATDKLKRGLLAWLVFVIALFSLFSCKRSIYILAAYPAAAMLIGASWDDFRRLPPAWRKLMGWTTTGLLCLLATGLAGALFLARLPFPRLILLPSACVATLGALLMIRLTRRALLTSRWLFTCCLVLIGLQITVTAVVLPAINGLKAPIQAAAVARAHLAPGRPVFLYRQQLAIFPLYAERPGRELHSPDDLRRTVAEEGSVLVVVDERQWEEVSSRLDRYTVLQEFGVGHKRMKLIAVTNDDLPPAGERQPRP